MIIALKFDGCSAKQFCWCCTEPLKIKSSILTFRPGRRRPGRLLPRFRPPVARQTVTVLQLVQVDLGHRASGPAPRRQVALVFRQGIRSAVVLLQLLLEAGVLVEVDVASGRLHVQVLIGVTLMVGREKLVTWNRQNNLNNYLHIDINIINSS